MKRGIYVVLSLFLAPMTLAQTVQISGTVTDQTGERLLGVNILVQGTQMGTITNDEGFYTLSASRGDTLVFSFVGMQTEYRAVSTLAVIDVQLMEDLTTIDELIVTAFGRNKEKIRLGYSAQSLDGEAIENASEPNLLSALNGKVAGLDITPTGGGGGAGANIVIRGYSSISGNNQPLFVVDGVPVSNAIDPSNPEGDATPYDWRAYSVTRGANRAVDLNQYDVSSVSVLKGGAATAMYGSRANNGVILINTKSGRQGFDIKINSSVDIAEISMGRDIQTKFAQGSGGVFDPNSTQNYGPAYVDNPVFAPGTVIDLNQDGVVEDVSGQPIPNHAGYYDEFWQRGVTTNNTISFSGGNERGSLYSSFTNLDQQTILENEGYTKRSFLLKGEYRITDRLTVGASSNYIGSDKTTFPIGYRGPAYALSTIFNPVYDLNDPWKDSQGNSTFYITSNAKTTPTWIINEEPENSTLNRLIGNVNLEYRLPWNLNLRYQLGIDNYDEKRKRVRPIGSPFVAEGDIYDVYINSRDINSDLILSGNAALMNGDVSMGFLVGNNIFDRHYDRAFLFGEHLNLRGFDDISNAKDIAITNSIRNKRIIGVFGQLDLAYKDYLFVELSARNDWSSTLSTDDNSFLYPSASLGFVFSEFWEPSWLSLGKIRASVAQVGNDAPIYATADTYFLNDIVGGQSAFSLSDEAKNNSIKPEISTTWEAGTDLAFLNNLIGVNFTYYNRTTKDQVTLASLPGSTGYTSYILNAGKIENKGVEATLSFNNLLRRSAFWRWDVDFNFTKNKNEVLEIPGDLNEIIIGTSAWFGASIVVRPGSPYGSVSGSYYERDDQGNLLIGDDGFPIIAPDRKILGDPNPDWRMNINNTLQYKNWGLNVLFDIKQGGELFNESRLAMWWYGTDSDINNVGTPHVFEGIVKSTGQVNTQEVILSETYYKSKVSFVDEPAVEDASWVRLRNVALSYRFPSRWLRNSFVDNVLLTASGRNLWISTPYNGTDPEAASVLGAGNVQIIDMFGVPGTRSYSFAINVNF